MNLLYGFEKSLLEGAVVTFLVSIFSMAGILFLGGVGAGAKLSSFFPIRFIANLYTTIFRGVPDLVMILLIYFGGQVLLNQTLYSIGYEEYVEISPFSAGVFAIGLIYGAYMTETFRGALLAIPKGQTEAAKSFGFTSFQIFIQVTFFPLLRNAIAGINNIWQVALKATALVSIIGLDDIVRKAGLAAGATKKPFVFYLAVCVVYLIFTFLSGLLFRYLEKKLQKPYTK